MVPPNITLGAFVQPADMERLSRAISGLTPAARHDLCNVRVEIAPDLPGPTLGGTRKQGKIGVRFGGLAALLVLDMICQYGILFRASGVRIGVSALCGVLGG